MHQPRNCSNTPFNFVQAPAKIKKLKCVAIRGIFITFGMENAFELAYDAYRQRKDMERQLRWQQLRADLTAPSLAAKPSVSSTPRGRLGRRPRAV